MVEIENRSRGSNIRQWHLIPLIYFHYTHFSAVLRRSFNLADMLGCLAAALPRTHQIVRNLLTEDVKKSFVLDITLWEAHYIEYSVKLVMVIRITSFNILLPAVEYRL